MFRASIKTKLTLVISLLVLGFILFNVVIYPTWTRELVLDQAKLSARQVAETASYALGPNLTHGRTREVAKILQGVQQKVPAFQFSAVYDAAGKTLARLGGQDGPGHETGRFLSPHGLAVDSRGDIYVGEVSYTNWPSTFPGTPVPKYLRSLQKLEKVV